MSNPKSVMLKLQLDSLTYYKDRGIKLTCRKTDELHDSVWIVDSTLAFVIGASFNGLAFLESVHLYQIQPNFYVE